MIRDRWSNSAFVIVAHGDRGSAQRNRSLFAHRDCLRDRSNFKLVACCFINGHPSIETVIAEAEQARCRDILIYPFFMSSGYFATTALTAHLANVADDTHIKMLPPLGSAEQLPRLLLKRAIEATQTARFVIGETRLIIVGHGSSSNSGSRKATVGFAERASRSSPFAEVSVAYLEEYPFLADVLTKSNNPTVVAGFLCGAGIHGSFDIPTAVEAIATNAIYSGSIGTDRMIPSLILETLAD